MLTRFQTHAGRVDLRAGGAGASIGLIELVNASVYSVNGTTLRGGRADVVIRTGAQGTTEVKEVGIWSDSAIRVFGGAGGSCIADKNSYITPVQNICR